MTVLTLPIALGFLAIFGLGCVLVCSAIDRYFPMNDDSEDETEADELDIADEVSLADTGRRWVSRPVPGQRGAA